MKCEAFLRRKRKQEVQSLLREETSSFFFFFMLPWLFYSQPFDDFAIYLLDLPKLVAITILPLRERESEREREREREAKRNTEKYERGQKRGNV